MNRQKAWLKKGLLLSIIASMGLLAGDRLLGTEVLGQTTAEEERGWGNGSNQQAERVSTGRKVALVIGNADYTVGSPLKNPVNDANDMAAALEDLGFEVLLGTNLSLQEMDELVAKFYRALKRGSVGVFYYAGHGVQSQGENYFMPVDAQIDIEANLKYEALRMGEVLNYMQDAENDINIVIIDACRDNPYSRGWRSNTRGLASVENTKGMLIAYATAPGDVAADGAGRNGVFTGALLDYIRQPGLEVNSLMTAVRYDVYRNTNERQLPWTASSLIGDFRFVDQPKASDITTTPPRVVAAPPQIEEPEESATNNSPLVSSNINHPQTFTEDLRNEVTIKMVKIPTGSFLMGSPESDSDASSDEFPQHRVEITEEYYMAETEVTQAQWEAVMGSNPSYKKSRQNPVEQVSWDNVQEFIQKLNQKTGKQYRLPSEAEWEYAARGGTQTKYHYGDDANQMNEYGWCSNGSQNEGAKEVGRLKRNQYGLYDMIGNVWEWTQDDWENSYKSERSQSPSLSSNNSSIKVLRGGSWVNIPRNCRAAIRFRNISSNSFSGSGFRLAILSSDL